MSDENKKKNDQANITEEENVKEQYEFGLNEDKRQDSEKEDQKLPEDQREVAKDAKPVDYKEKKDKE